MIQDTSVDKWGWLYALLFVVILIIVISVITRTTSPTRQYVTKNTYSSQTTKTINLNICANYNSGNNLSSFNYSGVAGGNTTTYDNIGKIFILDTSSGENGANQIQDTIALYSNSIQIQSKNVNGETNNGATFPFIDSNYWPRSGGPYTYRNPYNNVTYNIRVGICAGSDDPYKYEPISIPTSLPSLPSGPILL